MDTNSKSLLKHTLFGLIGGGLFSAIHANNRRLNDEAEEESYQEGVGKNQIVVPLSRKHYLKAIGLKKDEAPKKKPAESVTKDLQPMDIVALKRAILKARAEKTAACCKAPKKATCCKAEAPQSIKEKTTSVSTLSGFRGKSKIAQLRNPNGRFSTEEGLGKAAGILDKIDYNMRGTFQDGLGAIAGTIIGAGLTKAVADKIAINRKKKQVEKARREYANAISKEVSDDDLPFYAKQVTKDGSAHGIMQTSQVKKQAALDNVGTEIAGTISAPLVGAGLGALVGSQKGHAAVGAAVGGATGHVANVLGVLLGAIARRRKRKEQVEHDKKTHLSNFIPGVGTFNYTKRLGRVLSGVGETDEQLKTAQDRGILPSTLGFMGLTGVTAATMAAMVTFKVMENRRKAAERTADKDTQHFPANKSIKFTFK